VLHTWTRELVFHPHLHCIDTGGGLTADGTAWRSCKRDFLLPVRVMGALFRGKLLAKLRDAHRRGRLERGSHAPGAEAFTPLLDRLHRTTWIVYAKRPFDGPEHVVRSPAGRERAGCLAHARRKLFVAMPQHPDNREALDIIRDVYVVEHDAEEHCVVRSPEHLALRRARSRPLMDKLHAWLLERDGCTRPRA
jgi:hypothetical protein